jgi:hypothetical protein
MKRLLWVVVILCVACAPCAYADSFPTLNANITYVTASMAPNDGSGDNVYTITLIGPGTIINPGRCGYATLIVSMFPEITVSTWSPEVATSLRMPRLMMMQPREAVPGSTTESP